MVNEMMIATMGWFILPCLQALTMMKIGFKILEIGWSWLCQRLSSPNEAAACNVDTNKDSKLKGAFDCEQLAADGVVHGDPRVDVSAMTLEEYYKIESDVKKGVGVREQQELATWMHNKATKNLALTKFGGLPRRT